jgi:hypothetical protein
LTSGNPPERAGIRDVQHRVSAPKPAGKLTVPTPGLDARVAMAFSGNVFLSFASSSRRPRRPQKPDQPEVSVDVLNLYEIRIEIFMKLIHGLAALEWMRLHRHDKYSDRRVRRGPGGAVGADRCL